ncbi:ankyrin repeat domain-containing protein [Rhodopirellula islandica]|uniref:ankyrin repeat domain-containing protein n=1 Tax=Rhodopirellula islandica TaxID=595434 RepID=UPI000A6DBCC1|nr:ankyrin repeat domain-containing protein [Rhodopirellula islandica]
MPFGWPAIFTLAVCLVSSGCNEASQLAKNLSSKRTFHEKFGLHAKDFFDDPEVIKLCEAIEKNDTAEMQRLIDIGTDVNAKGRDNATPLLWAYFDNEPERFEMLLVAGADPNVKLTGDLGIPSAFEQGESVTWLSAKSAFQKQFNLVMNNGGDANITDRWGDPVIHELILFGGGNVKSRLLTLAEHGADIDAVDTMGSSPLTHAISAYGQYEVAHVLLDLDADPRIREKKSIGPMHSMVRAAERREYMPATQKAAFDSLMKRLEDLGMSQEDAEADWERWSRRLPPF